MKETKKATARHWI